ncbi:uncharacterized protein DEA37_0001847 [Paragonimus westermani]|uniref:Uncharacterized protein n=1 Tax=Paragonimus westermani TaxID=34504 RepID=A0A5J4NSZ4_9TREM|nr:uncharacterized protein DEA37_0001847 [Paragonimus westermani]
MQKVCEVDLIRFGVVSLQLVLTVNALLNKEAFIIATPVNQTRDAAKNDRTFLTMNLIATGAHTFGMLAMMAFLLNVYDVYAYRLIAIVSIFIPSATELITWVIFFSALCSKTPFKP